MNNPIWFKAKKYGWGWRPASWQGWVIIFIYIFVLLFLLRDGNVKSQNFTDFLLFNLLPVVFASIILILISYKFGEKPGWHWGEKTNSDHVKTEKMD